MNIESDDFEISLGLPDIEMESIPLTSNNPFELLSDDTIFSITQFLTPRDLLSFSETNRRLWYICKRDEVWTSLVLKTTGRVTYTRKDAINSLIQKHQEDTELAEQQLEFKQQEQHNKIERILFKIRDGVNCCGIEITTILLFYFSVILLQLKIEGTLNVGYWFPLLFCLPFVLYFTFIPTFNFCVGKYADEDDPPVRCFSSPIQTARYLFIFNPRGIGILNEPCILINYIVLFVVSLGVPYYIIPVVLFLWLLLWVISGCFVCDRYPRPQTWRGILSIPSGIILIIAIIIIVMKIEDSIDISYQLVFIPLYIFLFIAFLFPLFTFIFFCSLCLCNKSLDENGCWNNVCCFNVRVSDLAALKSLFFMLVASILCPFTMTFIGLLATNLDGTDDVSFYISFIPLDILGVFLMILYVAGKRYEVTHL
ncbi:hypothetical protein EDI_315400 [Entamoeba dispar SAW760]|uniref:F-box domain-containing protein n=1 Tax=Entamoeba dispar (strain ATCC PRA-260 / SAW760) TaxID=370354 RepID=B0E6T2_ENTDS|nr:uncharacterized protein EDI_315400 [Entamoeba dispar SAW760]EDR29763.1 hypothetical protein EDI_315400 [Entamoeba dispar SAW760]|eukprot:EDR29763.1 hypothetical protein EDI_315400 [Entamoeba dispar SAW760]